MNEKLEVFMKNYKLKAVKSFAILAVALFTLASSNVAYAKSSESKIKEAIDNASEKLKAGVEKCGDKIEDVQNYFHNYDWKGVIQEKATFGSATVTGMKFNGHHRAVVVKPGERIEGELKVVLDPNQIKDIKYHRLVIGFKDVGAQTAFGVGGGFGYLVSDKEHKEEFTLIAPAQPGLYQVRFRAVESLTETEALKKWTDDNGSQPDGTATIGFVWVKA
jgi:hypothetical protein